MDGGYLRKSRSSETRCIRLWMGYLEQFPIKSTSSIMGPNRGTTARFQGWPHSQRLMHSAEIIYTPSTGCPSTGVVNPVFPFLASSAFQIANRSQLLVDSRAIRD